MGREETFTPLHASGRSEDPEVSVFGKDDGGEEPPAHSHSHSPVTAVQPEFCPLLTELLGSQEGNLWSW